MKEILVRQQKRDYTGKSALETMQTVRAATSSILMATEGQIC
jgi:hypothetical protein